MAGTGRPGEKRQGEGTIAAADTNTDPTTVLDPQADLPYEAHSVVLSYDDGGTVTADVELHDEATDTAGGNFGSARFTVKALDPGEVRTLSDLGASWEDFEQAVRALPDGNQDAEIVVHADGKEVTALGAPAG